MNNSLLVQKQRIQAARGEIPADLVLKKGRVVDLFSGMVQETDVAIYDGLIVGLGPHYHGREEGHTLDSYRRHDPERHFEGIHRAEVIYLPA